jgi:hypothetical protein
MADLTEDQNSLDGRETRSGESMTYQGLIYCKDLGHKLGLGNRGRKSRSRDLYKFVLVSSKSGKEPRR